jgi:hypothetical protein
MNEAACVAGIRIKPANFKRLRPADQVRSVVTDRFQTWTKRLIGGLRVEIARSTLGGGGLD